MSVLSNLSTRFRLIRTALTRRFVYADVLAIARDYGICITDVYGDTEPFSLMARLSGDVNAPLIFPAFDPASFKCPDTDYTEGWSSEPSVSRFLGCLIHTKRAQTVIELGCFTGWSTVHMAYALSQRSSGRIYYLDHEPRFLARAADNLHRHGLAQWGEAVEGKADSPAVLSRLPESIDVVFIDTSHDYGPTLQEIDLYGRRLAPGGCLVLHDSISAPGVRRAVLENRERYWVHTFATERSNGLTVMFPRQ